MIVNAASAEGRIAYPDDAWLQPIKEVAVKLMWTKGCPQAPISLVTQDKVIRAESLTPSSPAIVRPRSA